MPSSPSATVYEPSANDPRVVAVIAAISRLGDVMRAQDVAGIETLMATDMLVNAPINKVVNRENVIGRIKAGQISYEPDVVRNIDFAGVRGDVVVVMGEEVVHPNKDAPYAGKTEYRRFTDVWKQFDGGWKLWIRQATVTTAE
jgi:ketosteroid isomerase-like protein